MAVKKSARRGVAGDLTTDDKLKRAYVRIEALEAELSAFIVKPIGHNDYVFVSLSLLPARDDFCR